ncbi:hypothetical protein PILCRDRAFT_608143 [Piloderma croceum F 1598]|uniref:Uncharacterized protein n=1 Tax=Piloderma croceum (strain F 1598) TaxID=765440 RepID=A0A0C3AVJ4_PILCF|nr:hypothetical protein PILCRDRAFT_608143 [Piloderma croceum F 1598]
MPGGQSNTRASKKRADLLASFDTLACHLQTTFTTLSTAIARSKSKRDTETDIDLNSLPRPREPDDPADATVGEKDTRRLARAYLAIVLGPSPSSSKARVMFAVDGLEVKVWGKREDVSSGIADENEGDKTEGVDEKDDGSDGEESESESSDEDTESEASTDENDSGSGSESESVLSSDLESGLESSDSIMDGSPPPSRSPSPSSRSSLSLSGSPSPSPEPHTPHQTQPQPAHSELDSKSTPIPQPLPEPQPTPTPVPPQLQPLSPQLQPQPEHDLQTPTYASEQQALRTAERLLSRTLATTCAEDDGKGAGMGMAAELTPTQTHILLRAPRRFVHPSWTPKQNWGRVMDGMLGDFLEDSGLRYGETRTKKKRKGGRIEGVWIRCRGSVSGVDEEERDDGEEDEDDEMIWWSWDGKIVGFSDW